MWGPVPRLHDRCASEFRVSDGLKECLDRSPGDVDVRLSRDD